MNPYRSLALLCAIALSSCDKNAVQDIAGPAPASGIKFFNYGVNAPPVNFYANSTKMTAILSSTQTESTNGVGYGAVAAGGFYSGIAPGPYALTGRIAAAIDKNFTIATVSATIADGKYYSFYMSGFYNATAKTVDGFVVEDPIGSLVPPANYGVAYVRFVHAIGNANPLTLYAKSKTDTSFHEVAVGAPVTYKGAGAFMALPTGVYDLSARYTDSTSTAISSLAVSFLGGRIYTVGARGDITVATGTNSRTLDNRTNY